MKKSFLFLIGIIVAAVVVGWVVLANKFENIVQNTYLPFLQEQKEKGIIDVDLSKIKIEKYKLKVIAENISFFQKSEIFKYNFDELSGCYNPFKNEITFYSSGKKETMGAGDLEVYILNPSTTLKISNSFFNKDNDEIDIILTAKKCEILSAVDNSVITKVDDQMMKLNGTLDKVTDQYTLKMEVKLNNLALTPAYSDFSKKYSNYFYNKNDLSAELLMNEHLEYYNKMTLLAGPTDLNWKSTSTFPKQTFIDILQIVKGEKEIKDVNFDPKKEPFNISINLLAENKIENHKLILNILSDGKEIKSNVDFTDNKHYTTDVEQQAIDITAESLTVLFNEKFNKLISQGIEPNSSKLVVKDLQDFSKYIIDIKDFNLSGDISYKIETKEFDSNLKLNINGHKMDLSTKSDGKNSYNGFLKLSDPAKLIRTKVKFAKEVFLPLIEKITMMNKSKEDLSILKNYIDNVEINGFEAISVFSKSQPLKENEELETYYVFEPENFSFKFNNKSFLEIITDERIVKFLKGFNGKTAEERVNIPSNEAVAPISPKPTPALDSEADKNNISIEAISELE